MNAVVYHFNVGAFAASIISDGTLRWAPYLPNVAANVSLPQYTEALEKHFLPTDHVTLHCNHLLLDDGRRRILVDTGNGPTRGPGTGHLIANLARAGYAAADISDVILTHAHPDHVWGTLLADGTLAFPNARHHISREEWEFWTDPDVALPGMQVAQAVRDAIIAGAKRTLAPLANTITLFESGAEVIPGVLSLRAPGHTPGHSPLLVHSEGHELLHAADTAYQPGPSLEHPEWQPALDADPELAEQSRRRILALAAEQRVLTLGFHFPFPGLGHVRAEGEGFSWEPAPWEWIE